MKNHYITAMLFESHKHSVTGELLRYDPSIMRVLPDAMETDRAMLEAALDAAPYRGYPVLMTYHPHMGGRKSDEVLWVHGREKFTDWLYKRAEQLGVDTHFQYGGDPIAHPLTKIAAECLEAYDNPQI